MKLWRVRGYLRDENAPRRFYTEFYVFAEHGGQATLLAQDYVTPYGKAETAGQRGWDVAEIPTDKAGVFFTMTHKES